MIGKHMRLLDSIKKSNTHKCDFRMFNKTGIPMVGANPGVKPIGICKTCGMIIFKNE